MIANVLFINQDAVLVIKSTVLVGYRERVRDEFETDNIIFIPEFLKAINDNLYSSRIVVG